jgi:hypothetical protein
MTETLHIIPVDDLIEHEAGGGCPCGPRLKTVTSHDGSVGHVVKHHPLDGRVKREYAATTGAGAA